MISRLRCWLLVSAFVLGMGACDLNPQPVIPASDSGSQPPDSGTPGVGGSLNLGGGVNGGGTDGKGEGGQGTSNDPEIGAGGASSGGEGGASDGGEGGSSSSGGERAGAGGEGGASP